MFFSSITISHAMSISSVAISITDIYNPDTDVGTVFNLYGKLRSIQRLAVGG